MRLRASVRAWSACLACSRAWKWNRTACIAPVACVRVFLFALEPFCARYRTSACGMCDSFGYTAPSRLARAGNYFAGQSDSGGGRRPATTTAAQVLRRIVARSRVYVRCNPVVMLQQLAITLACPQSFGVRAWRLCGARGLLDSSQLCVGGRNFIGGNYWSVLLGFRCVIGLNAIGMFSERIWSKHLLCLWASLRLLA